MGQIDGLVVNRGHALGNVHVDLRCSECDILSTRRVESFCPELDASKVVGDIGASMKSRSANEW